MDQETESIILKVGNFIEIHATGRLGISAAVVSMFAWLAYRLILHFT